MVFFSGLSRVDRSLARRTLVAIRISRQIQTISTFCATETKPHPLQRQATRAFYIDKTKTVCPHNLLSATIDALAQSAIDAESRERLHIAFVAFLGDLFHRKLIAWFDLQARFCLFDSSVRFMQSPHLAEPPIESPARRACPSHFGVVKNPEPTSFRFQSAHAASWRPGFCSFYCVVYDSSPGIWSSFSIFVVFERCFSDKDGR